MRQPVLLEERREGVPAVWMGLVQRIPVALGVEADGVSIGLDAGDSAMRNLVVFRELQSARVVGEQQSRSSG